MKKYQVDLNFWEKNLKSYKFPNQKSGTWEKRCRRSRNMVQVKLWSEIFVCLSMGFINVWLHTNLVSYSRWWYLAHDVCQNYPGRKSNVERSIDRQKCTYAMVVSTGTPECVQKEAAEPDSRHHRVNGRYGIVTSKNQRFIELRKLQ